MQLNRRNCHGATTITRRPAAIVVTRGLVMATLDDDTYLRILCAGVVVHEPHRNKWQLTQSFRLHWNILELRKPGYPALRVMWYCEPSFRKGIVGDVPVRSEPFHDSPSPASAHSERTIHDAAPVHAAERGEATLSPVARNQPRLERKRVLAQLEHQAKTFASLALLLGIDQKHAGAKVAPLQDMELLPVETRVYTAVCLVEVLCPDQIRWVPEIDIDVGTTRTTQLARSLSIRLRFVSASRLMRRLKREVDADALLREEPSLLQILACSCPSSARANGPSASTFPVRPLVRPFTYFDLPWESTMSNAMVWPARRFGSTTCRTLVVSGLGLSLGLG